MKIIAYILLSPLVWFIGTVIVVASSGVDLKKDVGKKAAYLIGFFILLAFWATLFL